VNIWGGIIQLFQTLVVCWLVWFANPSAGQAGVLFCGLAVVLSSFFR